MQISKRSLIVLFIVVLTMFFSFTYEVPYYVYKPGAADPLEEMIEIEQSYESEGDFHLVTVSGGQATPIYYLLAKILPYHDLVPIEDARPDGISDEDYMNLQLKLMESSHHSSKVVAYKSANEAVEIVYRGVYIMDVVEGMPAEGIIKVGDRIHQVDGNEIKEATDLVRYVEGKQAGDVVEFLIERDGKTMTEKIEVVSFPEQQDKVGIGVQLVADQQVEVERNVTIKSGKIGGPSAGLMFALEMYDKLVEEDITKGYNIAGSGEIDFDGNVSRIGGIDKKVVAAHRNEIDIFFAPNENGDPESNYMEAKETANQLNTEMEIIPIDTFEEALDYLDQLKPKN